MTAPTGAATVQVQLINQLNTGWVALDEVLLTRVGQETVIKRSSYGRGRAAHRHSRQQPSHQREQCPTSTTARAASASIDAFVLAVDADALGAYNLRDSTLEGIYNLGAGTPGERVGNSMEDLRLSVRGWRLGNMVVNGDLITSQDIANWLAIFVAEG